MSPLIADVSWETIATDFLAKFDDINLLSSEINPVTLEEYKCYYKEVGKIHRLRSRYDEQLYPNDEEELPETVSGDLWEKLAKKMYMGLDNIDTLSDAIKPSTVEGYSVYRQAVEESCAHAHVVWDTFIANEYLVPLSTVICGGPPEPCTEEEDIEGLIRCSGCTREGAIKAIADSKGNMIRAIDLASGGDGIWLDDDGNPLEDQS